MKYSDFKKMPYRQRRDFIKNGGKVERTIAQKLVYYGSTIFIILVAIWFVKSCANQPRDNQQISGMMISQCVTEVQERLKAPDSFDLDRSRTLAVKTTDGYRVDMFFKAKNPLGANLSGTATCAFNKLGTDNKPLLESTGKAVLKAVTINGK